MHYNLSYEQSVNYIKDGSVDLFFCDPPYFISGNKSKDIDLINGDRSHWDKQWNSKEEYYQWTRDWLSLAYKQLKETGSIYVCSVWQHSGKIQEILEEIGFSVINRITWKRDKGRGANRNYKSMHEDIWFAVKNQNYKFYVDDDRESPALEIIDEVVQKGGIVSYNDPFIPEIRTHNGHEFKSVELNTISDYDIVVVTTNHSAYDFDFILKNSKLIVDLRDSVPPDEKVYKL